MKGNIEVFNQYIDETKSYYATLDMAQSWEDDVWVSQRDLAGNDPKKSIHFRTIKKTPHQPKSYISNQHYVMWCKAEVTRRIKHTTFSNISGYSRILKHLHRALLEVKGEAAPWLIDDSVIEQMENNFIATKMKGIKVALDLTLNLLKTLRAYGVISVGITFTNNHVADATRGLKELQRRRKKASAIDDNEREDENKLISMKALHSLAWLSFNAKDIWEQVAIRYYHILMVTGFRIGELLRLKSDALVSVAELNETTGKAIFIDKLDDNGNQIFDKSGEPLREPQMIWGIRYHPEKGHIAKYNWLESKSAQLVISAFEFINEHTTECRKQLKHLEYNFDTPIVWKQDKITYREINKHLIFTGESSAKHIVNAFASKMRNQGVYPIDEVIDSVRVKQKQMGKTPMQPVYSIADLNTCYRNSFGKHFNTAISFKMGDKKKDKKTVVINKSDLLCIMPQGALSDIKNNSSRIVHIYPDVVDSTALGSFFGRPDKRHLHSSASIFIRYNLTEDDGSNIQINPHLPRHQLNTFLALADVEEHQQALIVGRGSIEQNRSYQHLSLKDKTKYQITSTDNLRNQVNNSTDNKVLASEDADENGLLSELNLSPKLMSSTPSKLHIQQNMHAFNKPEEQIEFMQEALEKNSLLGELQDTYNEIRQRDGLKAAKEFIEVHGRNFHIVVNGSCTRNLALHGCDKQLRCLDGEGCFHLIITGRPGELESIKFTHHNLKLNVIKMTKLLEEGKLVSRREVEAFEREKHNLAQMDIVLRKAEEFSGFIPIRVFDSSKRLNHTGPKSTVVESFAQDQRKLKKGKYHG